jgi:hypothetical protein
MTGSEPTEHPRHQPALHCRVVRPPPRGSWASHEPFSDDSAPVHVNGAPGRPLAPSREGVPMLRWIRTDARLTRSARPGASRTTKLVRHLLPAACALLLAAPAFGVPSYRIWFQRSGYGAQYDVTQSTPFQHGDSYIVPATTNATFTGSAFAYPGHVGVDNRVEQFWTGQASSIYEAHSNARADDFVISGRRAGHRRLAPPGSREPGARRWLPRQWRARRSPVRGRSCQVRTARRDR